MISRRSLQFVENLEFHLDYLELPSIIQVSGATETPEETERETMMNANEIKAANLKLIGEWGYSNTNAGRFYAKPEDAEAVRAAYNAADDTDIIAAGGIYVRD